MSTHNAENRAGNEADPNDEFLDVDEILEEAPEGSRRLLSIGLGILLLPIGIVMIPFAGPGWAVVAISLNLIWPNNALTRWIRRNWPGIDDDGKIPRHQIYIAGVIMVVATVVSVFWGADILVWVFDALGITWDVPFVDAV